jgi:hypothetical protein
MIDSDGRLRIRKPSGGYADYASPEVRAARARELVTLQRQLAVMTLDVTLELEMCLEQQ